MIERLPEFGRLLSESAPKKIVETQRPKLSLSRLQLALCLAAPLSTTARKEAPLRGKPTGEYTRGGQLRKAPRRVKKQLRT